MADSYNPFQVPDEKNENLSQPYPSTSNKAPTVQTNIIDDYEPFQSQPAILQTEMKPKVQPKVTSENLDKFQKDLDERSQRLAAEEERLRDIESNKDYTVSINNFPPFPKCCPLKPCFYQAIDVEIPDQYRFIVRLGFILWLVYSITLFINIFGTMAFMIANQVKNDSGPLFGVSILYFLLFVPLSYVLWFRPLYSAFKNNSSFKFFLFFIVFGVQIIILFIQALGINVLGSCGWMISISVSSSIGLKVFMLLIATALTLELACCFFIIIKVNMYFRSSGGSIQKAKEEMSQEAASSSTLRSAATGIISSR